MAVFGSIDGRPETPGDGAGRVSASELRPVDAAGREWPETTEEGLMADLDVVEREAREAREEAARLRARLAALEAAARKAIADLRETARQRTASDPATELAFNLAADHVAGAFRCWGDLALDAVVSAAVAAERARIRARVEVMERQREGATSLGGDGLGTHPDGEWIWRDDVLSAIDATEGGAP